MTSVHIPPRLQALLRKVIAQHHPEILGQLSPTGDLFLHGHQVEPLQAALLSSFCDSGLRSDDEPNQRGLFLEELIDLVGRTRQ